MGRKARTAFRPPKARELLRANLGDALRGDSRMMSRLMAGSIWVTPVLAGRRFSCRARTVARASRAPLAPMEWPWRDLVELTGMCDAWEPKTWWMAVASVASLAWVPVPWALM